MGNETEQDEFRVVPGLTRDPYSAVSEEGIPAFQLVEEAPSPLSPAEEETQFFPGGVKDWVPASAGMSGIGSLPPITSGAYGSLLSQGRPRVRSHGAHS
jgi:hypothetical protein